LDVPFALDDLDCLEIDEVLPGVSLCDCLMNLQYCGAVSDEESAVLEARCRGADRGPRLGDVEQE